MIFFLYMPIILKECAWCVKKVLLLDDLRCGIGDLPEHTVRAYQLVNIKWKKSTTSTILPKEISRTMCPANIAALSLPLLHSAQTRDPLTEGVEATVSLMHDAKFVIRVPTLFELTLRTYYTLLRMSKHVSGKYGLYLQVPVYMHNSNMLRYRLCLDPNIYTCIYSSVLLATTMHCKF